MPAEGQQVGLDLWPREHDLPHAGMDYPWSGATGATPPP